MLETEREKEENFSEAIKVDFDSQQIVRTGSEWWSENEGF